MEQSPSWEANSRSAGQEICRVLWNVAVHCCVHTIQLLASILKPDESILHTPSSFL
jgi:hypothetical protein